VKPEDRVYVAGHSGLVGSALVRRLQQLGFTNLLLRSRAELDLADAESVSAFMRGERPQYVFMAAARVGGILANSMYPADFIRENLSLQLNVLGAAHDVKVTKLLFLGSSCVYPRLAPQPIPESALLAGPLEPTNRAYAVAKIAGIEMVDSYRQQYGDRFFAVMPTNLYGPHDNFDLYTSHVLPALIRKFHDAKIQGRNEVVVWGTGRPRREFLHVDDLADACIFLMRHYETLELINIGTGQDISIRELALLIASIVGFEGTIAFDTDKPDGPPRKLLDVSKLAALGWRPRISLEDGIRKTYQWYLAQLQDMPSTVVTTGSN
jgi:GDP-L-fucose synthase